MQFIKLYFCSTVNVCVQCAHGPGFRFIKILLSSLHDFVLMMEILHIRLMDFDWCVVVSMKTQCVWRWL